MDNEKIGKYIRELRIKENLSQSQLAEMIPISRQAVSKWERGKTIPDSQTLLILSKIFNVSIDSLLLGEKVEKKQQLEKLKLDIVDEYNTKNKKIKRLWISMAYYFINTYNTIKIYSVSGETEDAFTSDGLLMLSRDNMYFRLGDVVTDKKIEKLELYYKDSSDKLIFSTKDDTIFLRDYQGYNAYFEFKPYTDDIENIYLRIYYSESDYEDMELKFIKDFANDKLIFIDKTNKVSKTNENDETDENNSANKDDNTNILKNELDEKIQEKFNCTDSVCLMSKDNIDFTYFVEITQLNVVDNNYSITKEWNYFINEKLLDYYDYNMEKRIGINIDNNLKNEELELYLDFYSTYISKYILD